MRKKISYLAAVLIVGSAVFILYRLYLVEERRPLRDGIAAWKNEDYTEAIKKLEPLAERGDLIARSFMAQFYAFGLGVEVNNDTAQKWLSCDNVKSCVNGEPEYGFAYNFTTEFDSYYDIHKAKYWMMISSSKGYKKADEWLAKHGGN